jgi:signal transduction histidine kinase
MSWVAPLRSRPRLWMVFAAVGLSALVLGLFGIAWVRVYDDQLLRQTESELIAQGVVVVEAFRVELKRRVPPAEFGVPRTAPWPFPVPPGGHLDPILPTLRSGGPVLAAADDSPAGQGLSEPLARASGEALASLLSRVHRSTLAGLRVVDAGGVVVASSGAGIGGSLLAREELARALRGEPNAVLRRRLSDPSDAPLESLSRNTGVRVSVALPVIEGDRVWGAVLLTRTPMTLAKAFYGDRWNLGATGLVLLAVIGLISLAASALVLRPLRDLVRQVRAIAIGEAGSGAPIAKPRVEELAQISEALASMAAEVRGRNDYIRSFAANVSHEFKTPLASILGAVELLREGGDGMPPAQRARFLVNVEDDAKRLTELVRRLLELARADATARVAELAEPSGAEVSAVIAEVVERAQRQGLEARSGPSCPALRLRLPAQLLTDVLWQLVSNAQQHGGERVRVTLAAETLPGKPALGRVVVRDDGRGISTANRQRVFDAFFTTARDRGGTGLGLTIARSLLRPFDARLQLLAEDGPGVAFAVVALRADAPQRK